MNPHQAGSTISREPHYDVVVVGSGIVGLAHAYEAIRQGLRVAVVERASSVTGASVRNFGHACVTPQSGQAQGFAEEARSRWLELAESAGFWARESGTAVVARSPEELAVLEQYAAGGASVSLLTRDEILERVPVAPDAVGGAFLPRDLQVNPREAAPAIAGWLADQGVDFLWRTAALGIETGRVLTSRGILTADAVVVATGHDIDELFPEMAERVGLSRCRLHMVRARVGLRFPLRTPLFTGWSLLRYSGFAGTDAATTLRERLAADLPDGIAHDLNQMYTPQADGTLLIGDTHDRALDAEPFQSEAGFDLLLDQTRRLFGAGEIEVVERWQGVYASAPHQEFLIESPLPGVTVVTVTTGIGMTTALGVAPHVLAGAPLPL